MIRFPPVFLDLNFLTHVLQLYLWLKMMFQAMENKILLSDHGMSNRQMLENSISELRRTVTELEKKLSGVEDEDKLAIVRIFDQMPLGSLKEVLEQLKEEKKRLQNQLKDYELRLEQEAKAYHKANDERRMYLSEILQTSAMLKTVQRQRTDALTSKGEKHTLRGRCSVPQRLKIVNPQKGPIKKTAGVMQLPKLKS
ncbi:coiled-coil domain-containing protein 169-like isoform X2 [Lagopus leucura]|uniref:coiled-coil domain-containing protein 169-like isoform X2 n=1 Tax=Lagopus leucura TaxID=30410 RepID=UPI001C6692A3|nr:coiled-coil domain-containing protein 169-like isoform X2 [Lagopus leucura]